MEKFLPGVIPALSHPYLHLFRDAAAGSAVTRARDTCRLHLPCSSVMRERFSSLVTKPVYTFEFERTSSVDQQLLSKLRQAVNGRAVVVSHPTAVKSFVLKFVELMDTLERAQEKRGAEPGGDGGAAVDLSDLQTQADMCQEVLALMNNGVLLLDEVRDVCGRGGGGVPRRKGSCVGLEA
eukprot:357215-Chlamydomonas_euryale.AAC.1